MPHQRADFLGAWRLEHWRIEYAAQRVTFPFGESPSGLLVYSDRVMTASVFADQRPIPEPASLRSAQDELKAALFDSAFFYAGTWFLDGDHVVHEVNLSLNPAMVGVDQRRHAQFDGRNCLQLSAEETGTKGTRTHRLSWHRV